MSSSVSSPFAEPPIDADELCARVRFALDEPVLQSEAERADDEKLMSKLRASIRSENVRVSARTMPDVARQVALVSERLLLTTEPEVFVTQSPVVNAFALRPSFSTRPLILLHSALVQLLAPEEVALVIGHEFGHALLRHQRRTDTATIADLFTSDLSRAQEVSADRVGLIASESLEIALRAEIRLATGLDDRHLRFDLAHILADAEDALNEASAHGPGDPDRSHPEFAFRLWALSRFASSEAFRPASGIAGTENHAHVESAIEERFHALSDGAAFYTRADILHEALAWMGVLIVAHDDVVTAEERATLVQLVGSIWADDAIAYARRHGLGAVRRRAEERLEMLSGIGSRSRNRLERALREFAPVAGSSERCDEMVALVRAKG